NVVLRSLNMKSHLVNLAKIIVTLALFAFLLTRIDLRLVGGIIAQANLPLLGAVKWQILVKAQAIDTSLGALLSFSLMGLFFGNIMPSNIGGDVVRAYD